jgi:hypothetical protein
VYLDGVVTKSKPVAAGVGDSTIGCIGVDGKPDSGDTLHASGVGDGGESYLASAPCVLELVAAPPCDQPRTCWL